MQKDIKIASQNIVLYACIHWRVVVCETQLNGDGGEEDNHKAKLSRRLADRFCYVCFPPGMYVRRHPKWSSSCDVKCEETPLNFLIFPVSDILVSCSKTDNFVFI